MLRKGKKWNHIKCSINITKGKNKLEVYEKRASATNRKLTNFIDMTQVFYNFFAHQWYKWTNQKIYMAKLDSKINLRIYCLQEIHYEV